MITLNNKNDMDTAKYVLADARAEIISKMIDLDCTTEQRAEIDKLFRDMIIQYIAQKYDF